MPDREKVMRGLAWCIKKPCHPNCPYFTQDDKTQAYCLFHRILPDTLALLNEQEPRVMTREEVLATPEGAVVWFEERSDDSRVYIGPLVSDGNGYFGDFGRGVDMHAAELKRQRCWTSRPTEEQRKAVPWELKKEAENGD